VVVFTKFRKGVGFMEKMGQVGVSCSLVRLLTGFLTRLVFVAFLLLKCCFTVTVFTAAVILLLLQLLFTVQLQFNRIVYYDSVLLRQ